MKRSQKYSSNQTQDMEIYDLSAKKFKIAVKTQRGRRNMER